jgi:fatty-acid desaturase
VDTDDDPYNANEGFWYAHMGWLPLAIVANLAVVIGLGLLTGRLMGMLVIALLLRVMLVHHATWLINSAAHAWGSRRLRRRLRHAVREARRSAEHSLRQWIVASRTLAAAEA